MVLRSSVVDFAHFKLKLQERVDIEKRAQTPKDSLMTESEGFDGEGKPGLLDPSEPLPVQQLRARMRVLHHPISTENTYADWIARLVRHVDDEDLPKYGEDTLGEFLTERALYLKMKRCHPPLAIEPQSFLLGSPRSEATTESYKRLSS